MPCCLNSAGGVLSWGGTANPTSNTADVVTIDLPEESEGVMISKAQNRTSEAPCATGIPDFGEMSATLLTTLADVQALQALRGESHYWHYEVTGGFAGEFQGFLVSIQPSFGDTGECATFNIKVKATTAVTYSSGT